MESVNKTCSACGDIKATECFCKKKKAPDGLQNWCKECKSKAHKASRGKNKARETIVTPETKRCPGCKTEKSNQDFSKSNRDLDGLQSYCNECKSKAHKAQREKNKARAIIVVPEFKTCPGCKTEKSSQGFHKSNSNPDGLDGCCKECSLVNRRERKYGASPEWQRTTLEAQGGACAICKFIPGLGGRGLDLDHKHDGDPRGFLHGSCNRGLGHFKDDVVIIGKAIEYLGGPMLGIVYREHLAKHIKNKILVSQGYLCKICSVDLRGKAFCIDHDHLTGMVRGALCFHCNCGLGMFDDSIELLQRTVDYLKASHCFISSPHLEEL